MDPAELVLTEEELAQLDAKYTPFPSFSEWSQEPDNERWAGWRSRLTDIRNSCSQPEFDRAAAIAMRAAAFDSGAIEGLYTTDRGFTITVATQAASWETQLSQKSENALALFQAQLAAYELVLDAVATEEWLNEAWIRRLHEVLCDPQQTYVVYTAAGPQQQELPKGQYKVLPNHVRTSKGGVHAYAPVAETAMEMERLMVELRSDRFLSAHPVEQASFAHYGLVCIHPFADGNGRVARALGSVFFYRDLSLPLLIFEDQKNPYFDALEAADEGETEEFSRFILARGFDVMRLVIDELKAAQAPDSAQVVDQLKSLLTTKGGLTHRELGAVAEKVVQVARTELEKQIGELGLPQGVSCEFFQGGGIAPDVQGLRQLPETQATGDAHGIRIRVGEPAKAGVDRALQIALADEDEYETSIVLIRLNRDLPADQRIDARDLLPFSIDDVHPEISAVSQLRLRAFVRRFLSDALKDLLDPAAESLRQRGYRRPG